MQDGLLLTSLVGFRHATMKISFTMSSRVLTHILHDMAVVTKEDIGAHLGHVDLHSNQTWLCQFVIGSPLFRLPSV
jgi:hypothetical protein